MPDGSPRYAEMFEPSDLLSDITQAALDADRFGVFREHTLDIKLLWNEAR
jgi:hypothetical protein